MQITVPYPVLLGSLLHGNHRLSAVRPGSVTHQAKGGLILLAGEFQSLLVPVTHSLPLGLWPRLQPQAFHSLRQVPQLPVGMQVSLQGGFSALEAGEVWLWLPPALAEAGPAEVLPTLNGHRVCEILQADGASHFVLEALGQVPGSHGPAALS